MTNVTTGVSKCYDYFPFGEDIAAGTGGCGACFPSGTYSSATPDGQPVKFTGKERDVETGLDYFGARYFSAAQGRFTTPDWSARPQPVPYADLSDPQTLNLYGYVRNNPLSAPDPDGHCCWDELVSTYNYVKSVGYIKIEGGVGLGVSVKAGPVKMELEAKHVSETRIQEPVGTKKDVLEFAAKVDVGPAKVGLAATGEKLTEKGDQHISDAPTEWKFVPGFDSGAAKGSGWDLGLGASLGVGLQGRVSQPQLKVEAAG